MKNKVLNVLLKFQVLAIILVIIDQITKIIFKTNFEVGEYNSVIKGFFYIKLVYNTGAAGSIFSEHTWLLTIFSILACVGIEYYLIKYKPKNKIVVAILLVLLAGAFGNLIDRLFFQKVTDFLCFYIFGGEFPTFNFADICVTLSCFSLIIYSFFTKDEKDNNKKQNNEINEVKEIGDKNE